MTHIPLKVVLAKSYKVRRKVADKMLAEEICPYFVWEHLNIELSRIGVFSNNIHLIAKCEKYTATNKKYTCASYLLWGKTKPPCQILHPTY